MVKGVWLYANTAKGVNDGLMPIEDSYIMLEHGRPKEARYGLLFI